VLRAPVEGTPALPENAVLLPKAGADALAQLGEASPLAQVEVIFRAQAPTPPDPALLARRALLAAATRKLAAAGALIAAGMGGEALCLLRDALACGCRAAAEEDPGEASAALLGTVYGALVPAGAITEADAAALAKSGELARAFAGSAEPPTGLLAGVEKEARDLLARVGVRIG
jgi:hypothetical protein